MFGVFSAFLLSTSHQIDPRHILFGGTTVTEVRVSGASKIRAMVLNSGKILFFSFLFFCKRNYSQIK
jgi:hypothetical protein